MITSILRFSRRPAVVASVPDRKQGSANKLGGGTLRYYYGAKKRSLVAMNPFELSHRRAGRKITGRRVKNEKATSAVTLT